MLWAPSTGQRWLLVEINPYVGMPRCQSCFAQPGPQLFHCLYPPWELYEAQEDIKNVFFVYGSKGNIVARPKYPNLGCCPLILTVLNADCSRGV